MPYQRRYFSAIASRSAALPHVTAYWLMSAVIAVHAASFIGSGIGKSGKPWARFTASCSCAMRVISRMTDSVNVAQRCAPSTSAAPESGEGAADQLRRRHPAPAGVERAADRPLGVDGRVAQRDERADCVFGSRAVRRPHAARHVGGQVVELVGEVEDESLRLLASDARHALQRDDVALAERAHEPFRAQVRQEAERERWADPVGGQQLLKNAPLGGGGEAEEQPAVVAYDEVRVQQHV